MIEVTYEGQASATAYHFMTNVDEDSHGGDSPKTALSFKGGQIDTDNSDILFSGTFELAEFVGFCKEIVKLEKEFKYKAEMDTVKIERRA